jgi:hypothetical protein
MHAPCDLSLLTWARLANPSDAPCSSIRVLLTVVYVGFTHETAVCRRTYNATVPRPSEAHHSSKSVQTYHIPTIDLARGLFEFSQHNLITEQSNIQCILCKYCNPSRSPGVTVLYIIVP